MNTQGERIRYVREKILQIDSQEQLADLLRVSRGAVGNWELDKPIGKKNLMALARAAGVAAEWIAEREGDDPRPSGGETTKKTFVNGAGEPVEIPINGVREIDSAAGLGGGQTVPLAYEEDGEHYQTVEAFKAEPWIFPRDFLDSGLKAPASKIIAMRTQGDSMSPTINHGDVVLIDTRRLRVSPPGLYALRDIYGEIIVKRLDIFRSEGRAIVKITSDNPCEPTRDELATEVHLVGRVCGIVKIT